MTGRPGRDHSFRTGTGRRLRDLKQEYLEEYLRLHARARLGPTDDERKKALLRDDRLSQLTKLATIDLLPQEQLTEQQDRLGELKSCLPPTKRELRARPDCLRCHFHPSAHGAAAPVDEQLAAIDRDLDRVLSEWTEALVENLNDPTTTEQMQLLGTQLRRLVEAFLAARALPEPLSDRLRRGGPRGAVGAEQGRLDERWHADRSCFGRPASDTRGNEEALRETPCRGGQGP